MLDGSITLWITDHPDVSAVPLGAGRVSIAIDEDLIINGSCEVLAALANEILAAVRRGDDREAIRDLEQSEAMADAEDAHRDALEDSRF